MSRKTKVDLTSIQIDLPRELKFIKLFVLADLHIGDPLCDEAKILETIDQIKNDPNSYCIINGDIMNWASKTSVSDIYSETLKPMEQIQSAYDLLLPIKDKIIGILTGNHELRAWKSEGIDILRLVARQMGIEDRYSSRSMYIFLRFGSDITGKKENNPSKLPRKLCYTLFVNHGSGGGRREGSKVNRLADMATIADADIYIHSHTHLPVIMRVPFYRVNLSNSSIQLVDKLFINTGASLNYGGYGEQFEFKPSSKETPVIKLSGQKKIFAAEV